MNNKYLVVGLRVEKYIGDAVRGHNCDFQYTKEEMERHIICMKKDNKNYELLLQTDEGECGSGWCTASYGEMSLNEVGTFGTMTHRIIKPIEIYISEDCDDINNDVFYFSSYGGDAYYPSGGYQVNMDLFKELPRALNKRPVWIFYGESGKCKSTLANKLLTNETFQVYETDMQDKLPDMITQDVVVLGNRYKFSVDDVVNRIVDGSEIVKVHFE